MQKQGNTALFFLYDTSGLFGFDHIVNGTTVDTYYYRVDGKGEIIALTNSAGEVVANYIYDAWGYPTGITDASGNAITGSTHIGIVNPIRYKGYCYDTETGLYYLNSRYYDPEVCRFISADDVSLLGTDGSPVSYNLYAYCLNNPVNRSDDTGMASLPNWAKISIGCATIAVLAAATIFTGGTAGVLLGAALTGAVSSSIGGAAIGAIAGGVSGGVQGALDGASTGFMSGAIIGGVTGALSAGLGPVQIVGSAQKTGTLLHRAASNIEAGKMALQGWKYSKVLLNRRLSTAGLIGRRLPDVIGVTHSGSSLLIEVVSKSQTYEQMIDKCIAMTSSNPGATYKVIRWASSLSHIFS